jgi:hypothetical protein
MSPDQEQEQAMSKIVYLSDAVNQRLAEDARFDRRNPVRVNPMKVAEDARIALGNHAIGLLCRRGKPVFYAFVNRTPSNPEGMYVESTDLLGLHGEFFAQEGGAA